MYIYVYVCVCVKCALSIGTHCCLVTCSRYLFLFCEKFTSAVKKLLRKTVLLITLKKYAQQNAEPQNKDTELLFFACHQSQNSHGEQWVHFEKCYCWAHEYCRTQDPQFAWQICRTYNKRIIYFILSIMLKTTVFKSMLITTWIPY
jgi:hypothetical protein